ncbi:YfaP family protein [Pseudomonas sp.]|uniref:YfaP family protein n=1 Tax=Pseudomonas sp. TaxID=306 RepID=UPI003CC5FB91
MTPRPYPTALLLSALLALPAARADSNPISLDTPIGGWRSGTPEGEHFRQTVNYPASSVNTPTDQADTARIMGDIKGMPKSADQPGKVIVNGVAMPLKLDGNGHFDRPFSFPSGTNGVEIRSPDGQQKRRVQFLNTGSASPAKLRILLSWDSDNTDLDLHVITPDGAHIWYGDRTAPNGAALDVDVTTGYGPEIFAMPAPQKGQYLIYVNYFGGGYRGDDEGETAVQSLTTAQITLITEEGTPNEKMETFLVPMRAPGELTLVRRFSYP